MTPKRRLDLFEEELRGRDDRPWERSGNVLRSGHWVIVPTRHLFSVDCVRFPGEERVAYGVAEAIQYMIRIDRECAESERVLAEVLVPAGYDADDWAHVAAGQLVRKGCLVDDVPTLTIVMWGSVTEVTLENGVVTICIAIQEPSDDKLVRTLAALDSANEHFWNTVGHL